MCLVGVRIKISKAKSMIKLLIGDCTRHALLQRHTTRWRRWNLSANISVGLEQITRGLKKMNYLDIAQRFDKFLIDSTRFPL